MRDPRDFVRSAINNGSFIGIKKIANKFIPYWEFNPKKFLGIDYKLSPVGILAANWFVKNTKLNEGSDIYKENYLLVKFEDIFYNSIGLRKIENFLGVKANNKNIIKTQTKINKSKKILIEEWKNWDASFAKELYDICGDLMSHYGYGQEDEWKILVSP